MKTLQSIAVVDDDSDILAIIELCLREFGGYDVTTYEDGVTFLQEVGKHKFDLVLSDMMMPLMSGLELLAEMRVRDAQKNTPIVFMTAKAQKHEVDSYRQAGATDVITKPFDPLSLADQIGKIWSKNMDQTPPSVSKH